MLEGAACTAASDLIVGEALASTAASLDLFWFAAASAAAWSLA